jgi:uncharacterized membrane protein YdbT with pleckstrin-like domain
MSYIESNLVAGEHVVYQTRLHWIVMLGHILLGCLLFALPGAILLYYGVTLQSMDIKLRHFMDAAGAALLVGGLIAILMGMVRRSATEMAVTNRRVVVKTGLASRRTIEMLLNKVETIEVQESALGRLMGYGTVVLVGTGGSTEPFHKVAHPLDFRGAVQQQIEKLSGAAREQPPP